VVESIWKLLVVVVDDLAEMVDKLSDVVEAIKRLSEVV
jgi:hypothetical protein